jgi:hypothetical protein
LLRFFLLLVGAHFCGDLLSYSPKSSGIKRADQSWLQIKALTLHCLIHALWVWAWIWPWESNIKIKVSFFLFAAHFIIDFIRPRIEAILIPKEKFVIFKKKKDVLLWFKGQADKQVTDFLDAYFYRWLFVNVFDQGLHIASLIVCTWLFYSV